MQIMFVLKDKLNCTMKKMHGFHGNRSLDYKHGVYIKIDRISTFNYPRLLNMVSF